MGKFNYEKNDALWNVLRRHRNGGVTSPVAAAELKWPLTVVSAKLGKLAMYGVIDRVPDPNRTATGRAYRYSMKAPEHV